jgi:hypothetical protein
MSGPSFRMRLREAARGLKARASASPDIWDDSATSGPDWTHPMEDVSTWLELPSDFMARDGEDTAP